MSDRLFSLMIIVFFFFFCVKPSLRKFDDDEPTEPVCEEHPTPRSHTYEFRTSEDLDEMMESARIDALNREYERIGKKGMCNEYIRVYEDTCLSVDIHALYKSGWPRTRIDCKVVKSDSLTIHTCDIEDAVFETDLECVVGIGCVTRHFSNSLALYQLQEKRKEEAAAALAAHAHTQVEEWPQKQDSPE